MVDSWHTFFFCFHSIHEFWISKHGSTLSPNKAFRLSPLARTARTSVTETASWPLILHRMSLLLLKASLHFVRKPRPHRDVCVLDITVILRTWLNSSISHWACELTTSVSYNPFSAGTTDKWDTEASHPCRALTKIQVCKWNQLFRFVVMVIWGNLVSRDSSQGRQFGIEQIVKRLLPASAFLFVSLSKQECWSKTAIKDVLKHFIWSVLFHCLLMTRHMPCCTWRICSVSWDKKASSKKLKYHFKKLRKLAPIRQTDF